MRRGKATFSLLILFTLSAGCEQQNTTTRFEPDKDGNEGLNVSGQTASVLSPSKSDGNSPAFQDDSPVDDAALPNEVVFAFLESLRSGDDRSAGALLTDLARRATEAANLSVQPPAKAAKYTVGQIEYISQSEEGAHVYSTWTETNDKGVVDSFEIKWVLRRQERNGWRVKGMITKLYPDQAEIFLDFEDPKDMLRKVDLAQAQASPQEPEVRQANNPNGENSTSNVK